MDDTESKDTYIPVNEADSTMYYDTEVSMIPDEEANTSYHNEEVNNAPHRNIPTDMIQMNDSLTVSTVTDDGITQMETPTATENNQLTLLSEADEDENQDEASQSSRHNMESTANASQDENNHNDKNKIIWNQRQRTLMWVHCWMRRWTQNMDPEVPDGIYDNENNRHMTINMMEMLRSMLLNLRMQQWLHHKCQSTAVSNCLGQQESVQSKQNYNNNMI